MNSGDEMGAMELVGGVQDEADFLGELGLGGEFRYNPSDYHFGEDLLSTALPMPEFEVLDFGIEVVNYTVITQSLATIKMGDLAPEGTSHGIGAVNIEDVELAGTSHGIGAVKMEDFELAGTSYGIGAVKIEDVELAGTSHGIGAVKMEAVALTETNQALGSSKKENVERRVTRQTPGTSKGKDMKNLLATRQTRASAKGKDGKSAVATQSTKAAAGKGGVKGRGRRKPKDEVADVLRLRPPRKTAQGVRPHVPDEEKTAEYFEHRRKNTEAARKCRAKKREVDAKRVEIIKKQELRIKELETEAASLKRDKKIYQDVIVKSGQSGSPREHLQPPQDDQIRAKKPRKSHRRCRDEN